PHEFESRILRRLSRSNASSVPNRPGGATASLETASRSREAPTSRSSGGWRGADFRFGARGRYGYRRPIAVRLDDQICEPGERVRVVRGQPGQTSRMCCIEILEPASELRGRIPRADVPDAARYTRPRARWDHSVDV